MKASQSQPSDAPKSAVTEAEPSAAVSADLSAQIDRLFETASARLDELLDERNGARREASDLRKALWAEQQLSAEIADALRETWRVLRAAGLLNPSNGVQLGQTSWYVKISNAEALSDTALAKVDGQP